jgi:hypothetical protein
MKKIIFTLFIFYCSLLIANAQWVQLSGPNGVDAYSLVVSGTNIFAGTSGGGVYLSTNNGTNWIQVNNGLTNLNVWSLTVSGTNIFAGTSEGVFISTNNGTIWSVENNGLPYPYSVTCLGTLGTNIYLGRNIGAYRSTNNGANWIATGLSNQWVVTFGGFNTNLFAGTFGGGVFRSTNYGDNWTTANSGLTGTIAFTFAVYGSNLFTGLQYNSSGVFISSNMGTNWNPAGLTGYQINKLLVSGINIFAATIDSGVFLSTNNGTNWTPKNQGFNVLNSIFTLLIANNYIFAAREDETIWRRPLAEIIGVQNISSEIPSKYSLHQNYPNPFNPTTKIRFDVAQHTPYPLSRGENISLKVYDILGKEIATLVNETLQTGSYEVTFDGSNLPSGIYFYQLRAGEFVNTKKLTLLK